MKSGSTVRFLIRGKEVYQSVKILRNRPWFSGRQHAECHSGPGSRLGNVVLLALRRAGEEVTYAAETHLWECDFVTSGAAKYALSFRQSTATERCVVCWVRRIFLLPVAVLAIC